MRITKNKVAGNTIISGTLSFDPRLQAHDRLLVHKCKIMQARGRVARYNGESFLKFEAHIQAEKAAA
jgi:hypothetical protein